MLIGMLLVIFFWTVVPGLITGWMLRERGRSFLTGLLPGAVFGPFGILATLAFIYVSDRRRARGHKGGRGRAVRVFYDIPVVGRLHVSTVWTLAGLATFMCLWMIGGISYEFYRTDMDADAPDSGRKTTAEVSQGRALPATNQPASTQTPESRLTTQTPSNTSTQGRAALLGSFSTQPGQTAQGVSRPENSSPNGQPTPPDAANAAASTTRQESVVSVRPTPPAPYASPPNPPAKAPAQTRETAIAEVTRDLSARGYRVHAALSGDAQTTTLSLSGATLTRGVGNQLLGNGRLRGALKAAGVRIVVMVNGDESWTYIL
ncbi:MAG: hypothetical protein QOH51_3537 [Acidobacteriota bacterium]|nr:hypothetical protein [Acidobacteriota bacterium]